MTLGAIGGTLGVIGGTVTALSSFSPLDLSPTLWLDAADTSTITDSGGAVSLWADKSGNGYDVAQASAYYQPTTGAATLNGLNVVSFDGSDSLGDDDGPQVAHPLTIFVVGQSSNALVDGPNDIGNFVDGRISSRRVIFGPWEDGWRLFSDGNIRLGTRDFEPHVLTATFDTVDTLRVDGVEVGSGNSGTGTLSIVRIGSAYDGNSQNLIGYVGEILIFDRALSVDDRDAVEDYLANKWGL